MIQHGRSWIAGIVMVLLTAIATGIPAQDALRAAKNLRAPKNLPISGNAPGKANKTGANKTARDQYWPQWRGPLGTGVAPSGAPPVEWSETENVRWKVALPGRGHSTPVIWGDYLFVTAAVPIGEKFEPRYSGAPGAHDNLPVSQRHEFLVLALRRSDGKIRWRRSVCQDLPHEGAHNTASLASQSPVVDADRVYVSFGSRGLYALDFDGNVQWKRDFGRMQTKHGHGEGTSPVLHDGVLLVNWDHEGQSFVAAIDAATGRTRWRREREEVTSWSTPIVVRRGEDAQAIVPGTQRVRGYDMKTGEVIWECGGLSANIVASPVAAGNMVYVGSSYEKRSLLAIDWVGARGDITGTERVRWSRSRGTPYVPSPLLYKNALYFLTHYQGILTRVDAASGDDQPGAMRLPGIRNVYASPVAAADRVYITSREGATLVLTAGAVPRPLAINQLDDTFNASAAMAGGDLYLRGEKFLYCLAKQTQ